MPANLANPTSAFFVSVAAALAITAVPRIAEAGPPPVVQNPSFRPAPDPVVIDFSPGARPEHRPRIDRHAPPAARWSELDAYARPVEPSEPTEGPLVHSLPEGLEQIGSMVVPAPMLDGAVMVPDAAATLVAPADPQAGGPDLSEICAFPEAVPAGVYDYDYRPGGEFPRFHTVYLNYLGAPEGLTAGGENSAEDESNIARSGHPFPVYGGGEERAIAVAQAVASDFQDWAVRIVYLERPPKVLPYTMVMVGGHYSDTTAGPSGGVAPLDCEDFGQRNVCYAFQNNSPATQQANVVSQEVGHTLGLGHTEALDSVMAFGYTGAGGDLGFTDGCAPTLQVSGQSAACVGVNKCHCGVGEQQDDKATLGTTFLPAGPDIVEPTITLTSPPDGSVFLPGESIRVDFEPWDDAGGYGWKLSIENEEGEVLVDQVDYDRALAFDLVGLPPGVYTFTGLIQDHADHIATHSITVTIEGEADPDGTAGSEGDGLDTGLDASGGASGDEGTAGDAGGIDQAVDEGCGCVSGGAPRPASMLWLVGLLGLVRRRR